jgi:hypothetical protein
MAYIIVNSESKFITMLNIINSQSTATQTGLQVPVNILQTQILGLHNLGNLRFVYNGQFVPAWLESINNGTATIWIKMPVSIPANSSITLNLYSNSGLNFDGVYWGEAPQLSPTYAEYDNGASVFTNYADFSGAALPSGWTAVSGTSGTDYVINNGLQLKTTTARIQGSSVTQNFILEGYFQFISNALNGWDFGVYSSSSSAYGLHPDSGNTGNNWTTTWYYNNGYTKISSSGNTIGNGYYFIFQLINNARNIITNFDSASYTTLYTASFTNSLNGAPITLGKRFDNNFAGQTLNIIFNWLRIRAYPPNGVMPIVELM